MPYSKETYNLSREALWTVTHLTEAMDSSGTAEDSRPQPDHNLLGQVIVWTSDLTTAAWITARLDVAVTHTDHSVYCCEISFLFWGKGNQEKGDRMDDPGNCVPLTKNVSYSDGLGEV
jgi:hypothetical protein